MVEFIVVIAVLAMGDAITTKATAVAFALATSKECLAAKMKMGKNLIAYAVTVVGYTQRLVVTVMDMAAIAMAMEDTTIEGYLLTMKAMIQMIRKIQQVDNSMGHWSCAGRR